MKTPFQILGIDESASDDRIKSAYLEMVRRYPPDRFPERFKEIKGAFEMINTMRKRLAYRLFHVSEPDIDALISSALGATEERIQRDALLEIISLLNQEKLKQII
jgi:DnaJ-class molecular chaperone